MLIEKINALEIEEDDLKQTIATINEKTKLLEKAKTTADQQKLLNEISSCRNHYLTLYWVSYMGYLKNLTDEKYLTSEELIAKYDSEYNNAVYKMYDIIDSLTTKRELIKIYGKRFFDIAHNQKILLSNNEELFETESKLRRKYRSIIYTPRINFQGEEMSLIKLSKYLQDADETIRKEAYDKRFEKLVELSPELTEVFKELLEVRSKIAKATNFKDYTDYSFIKMNRIDYTKDNLRTFKNTIIKYFVPIREKLKKLQATRLGEEKLSYYNSSVLFKDGNAKSEYDFTEAMHQFEDIFSTLDKDFSNLFNYMLENNLIDLEERENKRGGGITTFLPDLKCPVFINRYINTSQSFITVAHEFGHSYQLYSNKDKHLHENRWPTFDICEIHSTTMELLVSQQANKIFKADSTKHLIYHYTTLLENLIRIALIDDFQTQLYSENPKDINALWKKLYQTYYPTNDYDIDYFTKGIMWQSDLNRIDDPFYGIDYALATVYAFSFFEKYLSNKEQMLKNFQDFCKIGGEISFKEIATQFNLANPFDEESLKHLADFISSKIDEIL